MAKPTGRPSNSIPVRLNKDQNERIHAASALLGISKQDIMRMAMGIGIEALKNVNWNIQKLVADAAFPGEVDGKIIPLNADLGYTPSDIARAAEEPPDDKEVTDQALLDPGEEKFVTTPKGPVFPKGQPHPKSTAGIHRVTKPSATKDT